MPSTRELEQQLAEKQSIREIELKQQLVKEQIEALRSLQKLKDKLDKLDQDIACEHRRETPLQIRYKQVLAKQALLDSSDPVVTEAQGNYSCLLDFFYRHSSVLHLSNIWQIPEGVSKSEKRQLEFLLKFKNAPFCSENLRFERVWLEGHPEVSYPEIYESTKDARRTFLEKCRAMEVASAPPPAEPLTLSDVQSEIEDESKVSETDAQKRNELGLVASVLLPGEFTEETLDKISSGSSRQGSAQGSEQASAQRSPRH